MRVNIEYNNNTICTGILSDLVDDCTIKRQLVDHTLTLLPYYF